MSDADDDFTDKIDKIMESCGCWTTTKDTVWVTSPGFDNPPHVGISVVACPSCSPLLQKVITDKYGACEVK